MKRWIQPGYKFNKRAFWSIFEFNEINIIWLNIFKQFFSSKSTCQSNWNILYVHRYIKIINFYTAHHDHSDSQNNFVTKQLSSKVGMLSEKLYPTFSHHISLYLYAFTIWTYRNTIFFLDGRLSKVSNVRFYNIKNINLDITKNTKFSHPSSLWWLLSFTCKIYSVYWYVMNFFFSFEFQIV